LSRLDSVMHQLVSDGEFAGITTLVARHGKVVHLSAVGQVRRDDIFRINSMTKPITAVAMMILYEEGKWSPQDPIARYIPEFARLEVYAGLDATGGIRTAAPAHLPTMRELMTHTAGFSDGEGDAPIDRLYRDDRGRSIYFNPSLQAFIERLAQAPLDYEPGARWKYSVSSNIQGHVIEKLSGLGLAEFLRQRIFIPLRMTDTAFFVPPEKRNRLAALYSMTKQRQLVPATFDRFGLNYDAEPAFPAGGAGLVSTVHDYFRFAQMLLNGGELDGVRILSPHTVRLMMSNHLPAALMAEYRGGEHRFNQPRPGVGYGFGAPVVTDPGLADMPVGAGTYFGGGASGTWFWIDPVEDLVVVGMTQRVGWDVRPPVVEELARPVVYQALTDGGSK
jgi:CubicO group peptidase (beta-lactamase class C family)